MDSYEGLLRHGVFAEYWESNCITACGIPGFSGWLRWLLCHVKLRNVGWLSLGMWPDSLSLTSVTGFLANEFPVIGGDQGVGHVLLGIVNLFGTLNRWVRTGNPPGGEPGKIPGDGGRLWGRLRGTGGVSAHRVHRPADWLSEWFINIQVIQLRQGMDFHTRRFKSSLVQKCQIYIYLPHISLYTKYPQGNKWYEWSS